MQGIGSAMTRKFWIVGSPLLAVALAGCGGGNTAADQKQGDAALSAVLDDPIMVEPDLGSMDQSRAGLTAGEPGGTAVPLVDRSDAAVAAARGDALRLVGGKIDVLPSAESTEVASPALLAVTAEQLAAALPGVRLDCVKAMRYGMAWAARFPDVIAPYPRSNALEAAGVDSAGCRVRVALFVTPVGKQDVIGFFHARLRASGTKPRFEESNGTSLLTATSQVSARLVRVREREDGLVEVALATRD